MENNDNMEDDSDNNEDISAYTMPTNADSILAHVYRAAPELLQQLPGQFGHVIAASMAILFAVLRDLIFPDDIAFRVGHEEQDGQCILEMCTKGEAASLVVNSAPIGSVRALIEQALNQGSSEMWYWRQFIAVDSCKCSHQFHQFVRQRFVDFVASGSPGAFEHTSSHQVPVSAQRQPLLRVEYNRRRFRQSQLQFLLAFQRYIELSSALESDIRKRTEYCVLQWLLREAVARAARCSRVKFWPDPLPHICPWELHAQLAQDTVLTATANNGSAQVNHYLAASHNQADSVYGEAAGYQCLAMAAMVTRFHQLLGGTYANAMSNQMLDTILDLGNQLYEISRSRADLEYNAYLNFDDLRDGMQQFDRHGWPSFTHELNATSWDQLLLSVGERLHDGEDGFILIVNSRAVAVNRDRVTGHLYLFDSHGLNQLPTDVQTSAASMPPAFVMQFDNIQDLFHVLQVQFGSFNVCEAHMYRCSE